MKCIYFFIIVYNLYICIKDLFIYFLWFVYESVNFYYFKVLYFIMNGFELFDWIYILFICIGFLFNRKL